MLVRLAPLCKVGIHSLPFRKFTGQEPPLAARAQQVQDRAKHFIPIYRRRLGALTHTAQQWLYLGKLLSTDVAGVFFSLHLPIVRAPGDRKQALSVALTILRMTAAPNVCETQIKKASE